MTNLRIGTIFQAGHFIGGVQWLLFMFANTVVIPISIGEAFGLPAANVSALVERSFIITGAACLLQALWGHRLPLMEGQSGLWWGVMLILASAAGASGESAAQLGGELAVGIIVSGVLMAVLGFLGLGRILRQWFSPVVMGTYLFLLACQLSATFFKGMVGWSQGGTVDIGTSILSLAVIVLVMWLLLKGKGKVSQFAILIGISAGWAAHALLFPGKTGAAAGGFHFIEWFPLGKPAFNIGIMVTCVLTGFLNTTNTISSIKAAEPLFERQVPEFRYAFSFFWSSILAVVSGLLGLVPYAPYTSSIGFLRSTRILDRAPFIWGALLFMALGFVPPLSRFFSTMPVSVGDAVLFVAYMQLFGSALQQLEGIRFSYQSIYRIAVPLMTGLCIMIMPPAAFASLPVLVRPLLANGLLIGILLSVVINNAFRWSDEEGGGTPAR
ncbi:uracil/xanthine transporter [Gordoniibacillus kamchatkensis]|uniref:uracil/xanthine transporter n=1 Tax=Gordoniibacillus kamchatkensis TaxID=1590651 RepID=UPI00069679A7|nr:uracil/xanthine transporter [Paenibacillus sp. VKM B-2647]